MLLNFWHVTAELGAALRAKICKLPNIHRSVNELLHIIIHLNNDSIHDALKVITQLAYLSVMFTCSVELIS